MNLGYYDTIKFLDKLDGKKYYFKPYDESYYTHLFDSATLKRMLKKYNTSLLIKNNKTFIIGVIEKVCEELKINRFKVYNMPLLITKLKYNMVKHKKSEYYDFIKNIIANPNCSTIQMVLPLAPLHKEFGIKRIVVSTYQSVTGAGYRAINQMNAERSGAKEGEYEMKFPYPIDQNILPHIDSFLEDGYTKEEQKMVRETRKILRDESIAVSATTVRVPVQGGHSESVNVEFHRDFTLEKVRELMASMPGVTIQDDPANNVYPMPLYAWGKDDVFVGRLRRDASVPYGINLWCVSDNIRKGAATNAVQIALKLIEKGLLPAE